MAIRLVTSENPPKVGEYVLPRTIMKIGVVMSPRLVVGVTGATVVVTDPREGERAGPVRMKMKSILYATPSAREAERAFERNERLRREIDNARTAAIADIEAIS